MKNVNFRCAAVAGEASRSPSQPAGDRTTGISAKQGAEAAARNILSGNISEARIAAMTVNFTEAGHGDKPNRLPKHVGAEVKKVRNEFQSRPYKPNYILASDVPHQPAVELLLSPSTNAVLLGLVGEKLTKFDLKQHADCLDNVRSISRELKDDLYRIIMNGRFVLALHGLREGKYAGHDRKKTVSVIRNRIKCLAVRTAHDGVLIFGDYSSRPYGDHFAGFKTFLLMGHSNMATFAAPATVIQRFVAAAKRGDFDGLDEDAVLARLVQMNMLPSGADGVKIMRIARKVVRALKLRKRGYGSQAILNMLEDSTKAAAQLNRGDMKREGLSQRGFAEHRTGLTSSEGVSYIALELLRALKQVDEIVDAVMAGKPLPECKPCEVSKNALAFMSVILRSESPPDKNATTVRDKMDQTPESGPEAFRKSGRIPMESMLAKIRCAKFAKQCADGFGIDAMVWFRS